MVIVSGEINAFYVTPCANDDKEMEMRRSTMALGGWVVLFNKS